MRNVHEAVEVEVEMGRYLLRQRCEAQRERLAWRWGVRGGLSRLRCLILLCIARWRCCYSCVRRLGHGEGVALTIKMRLFA